MPAIVLHDLSPRWAVDAEEDAWLERLAAHLADSDHVVRVRPGPARQDDEDEPALARGNDGCWWVGRFIGELNFEGREVRIEPRLGIDVIGVWLARAMNLAILPRAATAKEGGPLIAQLLDRVWSAAVTEAARHGPPRFRRVESLTSPYVRGRLDVPGTIALRSRRTPHVVSRREGRSLENPVSRAIVLADRTLSSLLGPEKLWRPEQCDALLGQLRGEVGSRPDLPRPPEMRKVRYTPITRGFERVAVLSLEIARRRGTLTSAGGTDTSGVLLDVAELWELFLLHCARRAFGATQVEHGTATSSTGFLMVSESDEARRLGRLKPDLVIRKGEHDVAVVDAKYKRLNGDVRRPNGVDRGDLYQLAAYLAGHEVAFGALAYPPSAEGDSANAEKYGPWALSGGEVARFVRLSAEEDQCVTELKELVPS